MAEADGEDLVADGEACGDEALEFGGVGGFGAWGFEPGPAEGVGEVTGEEAFVDGAALDEGEHGGDAAAGGGVERGLDVHGIHTGREGAGLKKRGHMVRSWRVQAPTSFFGFFEPAVSRVLESIDGSSYGASCASDGLFSQCELLSNEKN